MESLLHKRGSGLARRMSGLPDYDVRRCRGLVHVTAHVGPPSVDIREPFGFRTAHADFVTPTGAKRKPATPRLQASRHAAQCFSASRTMKCTSVCETSSARAVLTSVSSRKRTISNAARLRGGS